MNMQYKRTGAFTLVDANGTSYNVTEFTSFASVTADGRNTLLPNRKEFQLQDGSPVNFSEDNGFEIASNGVKLFIPKAS